MAYDKTKYGTWRKLKVDRRTALALADDTAPVQKNALQAGLVAAVADIPTPGSATAATCANKINELLAAMRTAGHLSS